jgi:acetoin utilization protein AcuB
MQRHKIRHLPIFEDGKLLGVVSQRVLYFIESLTNVKSENIKVREAMDEEVLTVDPTATISEAAKLLVLNDGEVVGIFTTIDALGVLAGEEE